MKINLFLNFNFYTITRLKLLQVSKKKVARNQGQKQTYLGIFFTEIFLV